MHPISLIYTKNTAGIEHPINCPYSVTYLRPDGTLAAGDERGEIFSQFGKDAVKYRTALKVNPSATIGEEQENSYKINVERADGLPLTFNQFHLCVLANRWMWFQGAEDYKITIMPTAIQRVVAGLPAAGAHAWAEAMDQLEPDSQEQVVELADPIGAQLLLDAGLLARCADGARHRYTVPQSVAYCKVERP